MSDTAAPQGLTAAEAHRRLLQYGPSAVAAKEKPRASLASLRKFWAPVSWMLEATIALQLIMGRANEAATIAPS